MRIENLRKERNKQLTRVAATLIWENRVRPPQEIYFETTEKFASDISCNPHGFLIASVLPAMYFGEQSVTIDAEICPDLKDGLLTVMHQFHHWFGTRCQPIQIEAKTKASLPNTQTPARTGLFFSGGIDAWANLRMNRLQIPTEYPSSIKDCLVIDGLTKSSRDYFETAVSSFSAVSEEMGVTIIPVYTNIYSHLMDIDRNYRFWKDVFNGAALAAVAHTFSSRLTAASISSGEDIPNLIPLGSHPFIDPHYSSYDLKISHDGIKLSRLKKTELVADWDVAFQNLTVCNMAEKPPGRLNCGRCEKCIRTMTTLVALGKSNDSNAFGETTVSKQLIITRANMSNTGIKAMYEELIPLLEERNRFDLVEGIKCLTARYDERNLKGWLKKCDRNLLKGFIKKKISASG